MRASAALSWYWPSAVLLQQLEKSEFQPVHGILQTWRWWRLPHFLGRVDSDLSGNHGDRHAVLALIEPFDHHYGSVDDDMTVGWV